MRTPHSFSFREPWTETGARRRHCQRGAKGTYRLSCPRYILSIFSVQALSVAHPGPGEVDANGGSTH